MSDEIYWYVLFSRTGSELSLAERLKNMLGEGYYPFVPQKASVFRRHGKKSLFYKVCFPGYVFIESSKPPLEFLTHAFPIVYKQKDAYRFLNYGDNSNIAMRYEERIVLSKMLDNDRKIDISVAYKERDSVKIISGPLESNKGNIVRINNSRHEAVIALQMFGSTVSVSVGIEFIEKCLCC